MNNGNRYVQLWTDRQRLAGKTVRYCWASMTESHGQCDLRVDGLCPDDVAEEAWSVYRAFRAGEMPAATHEARWGFGDMAFVEIPAVSGV